MRLGYDRRDEERLLVITLTGYVTAAEIAELIDEQAESGTWSYAVLYDEREAHVNLSLSDIRRLALKTEGLSKVRGTRGPVAIVVNADLEYGVNRIVSAFADQAGYQILVFRSMDTALAYLRTPKTRV